MSDFTLPIKGGGGGGLLFAQHPSDTLTLINWLQHLTDEMTIA